MTKLLTLEHDELLQFQDAAADKLLYSLDTDFRSVLWRSHDDLDATSALAQ